MKNIKQKKLLFCALDIGGRIEHYSEYIIEHYENISVESFVKVKLPNKQYDADYTYHFNYHNQNKLIQWLISFCFFIYSLLKYDIIYIISGENILTRKLLNFEIWCYKIFKKKIVFHFVGGDIRNSDYLRWVNNSLTQSQKTIKPDKQKPFQIKLCRISEKYGSHILVTSPDLIEFFDKEVYYIPVFINHKKFNSYRTEQKIINENAIKVLHAPSNFAIKGSVFIENTLRTLQFKNPLIQAILTTDVKYAENIHPPYSVSKQTIVSLMEESQVVIDQLVIGWYGLQTIEALLTGNQVIVWIPDSLRMYLAENCPIIHFNQQQELGQAIFKAIDQKEYYNDFEAEAWVRVNHSIESNHEIKSIFNELFS